MSVNSEFEWLALIARMVRPEDVPRVLVDAEALRDGARRIAAEGDEVESATAAARTTWQRLPTALDAPGTTDPLHPAMDRPAALGAALSGSTRAIREALLRFAEVVDEFRPVLLDLRAQVEQLNRDVIAGAESAAVLTDLVVDAALVLMSGREERLRASVGRRAAEWHAQVAAVATDLARIRDDVALDLVVGPTTSRTAGLSGGDTGDSSRADFDLLQEWATGTGPRHHVFTGDDPFTRLLRRDDTVRADVALARGLLANGDWDYQKALTAPPGTSFNRSVGGAKGLGIVLGDARTWVDHLGGGSSGNVADSFLGSYAVSVVPLARVGDRSVRVRFTVSNATTLASGTRIPVVGYEQGRELDRFKNDQVPTGPLSATTQVVTWTQVVSWPARSGLRRSSVAR